MNYSNEHFLPRGQSNNAFSLQYSGDDVAQELFVPQIIQGNLNDLLVGDKVVFQDFDDEGTWKQYTGLQCFMRTEFEGVPLIVVDNHNHVFYFWHEAKKQKLIHNGVQVIHIDQHSDMREPEQILSSKDASDLEKVYEYTNTVLNVGNFLMPALKEGIVSEVIQVRSETLLSQLTPDGDYILDLDLDFFEQATGILSFDQMKDIILEIARNAQLITIATSPFFMDQKKAIKVVQELFG